MPVIVNAQPSLGVFHITLPSFPTVSAQMLALDASGNIITDILPQDIVLKENGTQRQVLSVQCPTPVPLQPLSSVLTIDISGSMGHNKGHNLAIAQAAARAWVESFPLGISECAITSFNGSSYLNQDFTIDPQRLLDAINTLKWKGSTEYEAGFIAPATGGVTVARKGKHKRVVVFLTDGKGQGNEEAIVQQALAGDIIIHCVTIGLPAPQVLKNIATRTGGLWFENVTTQVEASAIYRSLLGASQGGSPCTITWESAPDCAPERSVQISIPKYGISTSLTYTIPPNFIQSISIAPATLAFGPVAPPLSATKALNITAGNQPVVIEEIRSSDPRVQIISGVVPPAIMLQPGSAHTVTVQFSPQDSSLVVAAIEVVTGGCTRTIRVSGGYPGDGIAGALKLVAPNGGEVFTSGTQALITWSGIPALDTVSLEYSIDNGAAWTTISDSATGLGYFWTVPNTPSNRCLARVTAGTIDDTIAVPILRFTGHQGIIYTARFSPNGQYVATGSRDRTIQLWEATTGNLYRTLINSSPVTSLDFSPSGDSIVAITSIDAAWIWNVQNAVQVRSFTEDRIISVAYRHPFGDRIVTAGDERATLWRPDGAQIQVLAGATKPYTSVAFSPDGNSIATTNEDLKVRIHTTGNTIPGNSYSEHTQVPLSARFSSDSKQVISTAQDGTARIWDKGGTTATGVLSPAYYDAAFSPNGKLIATGALYPENGRYYARLWDAATGILLQKLDGHSQPIHSVDFSPDGTMLVTASADSTAIVWALNEVIPQADVSDSLWAIVGPRIESNDIDMGAAVVGFSRDSVISAYIRNTGTAPVQITTIQPIAGDAGSFSVVSGLPPFTVLPGDSQDVEFRFVPTTASLHTAQLHIITAGNDTLAQSIRAVGVLPQLELATTFVDFGKIELGTVKDTLVDVVIRNIGPTPVAITGTEMLGPDTQQFSVTSGSAPFTILPGNTHSMKLRFSPTEYGGTSGSIGFDFSGPQSPAVVNLFGEGTCTNPDAVTALDIPVIEANAGDTITIPVRLLPPGISATSGFQKLTARYIATIRYNPTLLLPVDASYPITTEQNGHHLITFSGEWASPEPLADVPEIILAPRFVAALGNAPTSPLELQFFWSSGCPIASQVVNGEFRLLDICRDGGHRLFFADNMLHPPQGKPNPAKERMVLEYELIEEGETRITIIDVAGNVVETLITGTAYPGRYSIPLNVSSWPVGTYFCVLTTPTGRMESVLKIER